MNILITAGSVYGKLDDNKIVSNRARGIWAIKLAEYLAKEQKYNIHLLIPDTMKLELKNNTIKVIRHNGFEDYKEKCYSLAQRIDVAILAAAVVNWIPKNPVTGKMPTAGYKEGDSINIEFYLAEHIINNIRNINPYCTLIGCKMLAGANEEELFQAAFDLSHKSRAHMIIANDLTNLKTKYAVHPDGAKIKFEDNFEKLYEHIKMQINCTYSKTTIMPMPSPTEYDKTVFNLITKLYYNKFTNRDKNTVHGAIIVPMKEQEGYFLVSPRIKSRNFTADDAAVVKYNPDNYILEADKKPSLNTILMIRMSNTYGKQPVIHFHKHPYLEYEGITVPYYPPGSTLDNLRTIPAPKIYIQHHGVVEVLNV